jgi:hypothetical protein
MKANFKTLRNDLYNVFVEGNAKSEQIARVFIVLAVPVVSALMMLGHIPLY